MGYIKEKVAYLRGLAEGMEIGGDAQGKLFNAIIATLDEMADAMDETEAALGEMDESIDDLYDEVDYVEEYLFDDEDDEDEDDEDECGCGCGCDECFDEDDFVEVECPNCGETVYFDQSMLEGNEDLICPNCNKSVLPAFKEDEEK